MIIKLAIMLFVGVLIGISIAAVLNKGADQSDRDRVDIAESLGLTITVNPEGSVWGVVRRNILIGTGPTLRDALDAAIGSHGRDDAG